MTNCSVPDCKSAKRKTPGISFHEFPSKEPRRSQWIQIIQSCEGNGQSWQPSDHSVICGFHFRPEDFKPNCKHFILLPEAIPNVFNDASKYHLAKLKKRRQILTRTVPSATKIRSLKRSRKEEKENDTSTEENHKISNPDTEPEVASVGCQTEILSVKMLRRYQDELRQAKTTASCLVKRLEMLENEIKELIDEKSVL